MYFGWITKTTFLTLLLLGVGFLTLWLSLVRFQKNEIEVIFLSVGQGDAILIQSGRQQILIDGGRDGKTLLSALGREIPFYDRTIEAVIATHPDADHIGGFSALLRRYRVEEYIDTGATGKSDDFVLVERMLQQKNVSRSVPGRLGTTIELGEGGKLTLLYPFAVPLPSDTETNAGSIVARFEFGETSFLFTGDLDHEETVLPWIEETDVLKVAHHGSRYSTSDAWLGMVKPTEAIVSVGKNSYGHPHEEVMERLHNRKIAIYRTDELGPIIYRCWARDNHCLREY